MKERLSRTDSSEFDVGGDQQDELFDVLSHPRRRFALRYLQTVETPIPVDELTTELVAWEVQRPVADRSCENRDAMEISLLHRHLPKMAEAGLVRYDSSRRTVTPADHTDELRAHLQITTSN